MEVVLYNVMTFICAYSLTTLCLNILQAALPQSITSFIFAKEYGLHADVLSTA